MGFQATSDADTLARALVRAGADLADLEPTNQAAGAVVLAAATPPHRTGTLAASLTVAASPGGVVIGSPLRYATFVHWGAPRRHVRAQPFLLDAQRLTTDEVVDLYVQHAEDTVKNL
jgi:hypothetical protein